MGKKKSMGFGFWDQDRTTIHQHKNWFERMSDSRKLVYCLVLLFVCSFCFYITFSAVGYAMEPWDGEYLTAADISAHKQDLAATGEGMKTILVVGCDKREGETVYRTDTIILVFWDTDDNTAQMLSIPRDSYAQIPGTTTKTKINHAYAYGGINMLRNTIEYLTGVEIDEAVEVDFNGFIELVDVVGGVEVYVDQDMINWDEGIELYEGTHLLDGKEALGYVRFRGYRNADIGRIDRQQHFIQLLAHKIIDNVNVFNIPKLANIVYNNSVTTFTLSEMISAAKQAVNIDISALEGHTLGGDAWYIDNISYWVLDEAQVLATLDELMGDEDVKLVTHILEKPENATKTRVNEEDLEDEEEGEEGDTPDVGIPVPGGSVDVSGNAGIPVPGGSVDVSGNAGIPVPGGNTGSGNSGNTGIPTPDDDDEDDKKDSGNSGYTSSTPVKDSEGNIVGYSYTDADGNVYFLPLSNVSSGNSGSSIPEPNN